MISPMKSNSQMMTYFHVMWTEKKTHANVSQVQMTIGKCYDGHTGPIYQEDGFIIDTRSSYTNRVEVTGCLEGTTSEINVIAKTKHHLSLQTMLRQHQALMMLWSFQTRMVLQ